MKYIKQITIIFSISLLGELLKITLPFAIPSSIYGLILMLLLLILKVVKVEDVKETSDFLIENMSVMFVPPAISIITVWPMFKDNLISYIVIIMISTFVVMVLSGLVTQFIERRNKI